MSHILFLASVFIAAVVVLLFFPILSTTLKLHSRWIWKWCTMFMVSIIACISAISFTLDNDTFSISSMVFGNMDAFCQTQMILFQFVYLSSIMVPIWILNIKIFKFDYPQCMAKLFCNKQDDDIATNYLMLVIFCIIMCLCCIVTFGTGVQSEYRGDGSGCQGCYCQNQWACYIGWGLPNLLLELYILFKSVSWFAPVVKSNACDKDQGLFTLYTVIRSTAILMCVPLILSPVKSQDSADQYAGYMSFTILSLCVLNLVMTFCITYNSNDYDHPLLPKTTMHNSVPSIEPTTPTPEFKALTPVNDSLEITNIIINNVNELQTLNTITETETDKLKPINTMSIQEEFQKQNKSLTPFNFGASQTRTRNGSSLLSAMSPTQGDNSRASIPTRPSFQYHHLSHTLVKKQTPSISKSRSPFTATNDTKSTVISNRSVFLSSKQSERDMSSQKKKEINKVFEQKEGPTHDHESDSENHDIYVKQQKQRPPQLNNKKHHCNQSSIDSGVHILELLKLKNMGVGTNEQVDPGHADDDDDDKTNLVNKTNKTDQVT